MCIFGPSAFCALPAVGLSPCSRLRGTQGARPDPARKFGSWPRSVASRLGEGFRARVAILVLANPRIGSNNVGRLNDVYE